MADRLLVLCYHNVDGTWCFPSKNGAGVRGFTSQLRVLRRVANVVDLGQALERLANGVPLPRRAVALTFDDGYADNLRVAAPLLERLSLPATFFLVPGLLSRTVTAWWETTAWAFMTTTRERLDWEGTSYPLTTSAQRSAAHASVERGLKTRNRADRESAVEELVERLAPSGTRPGPEMFLDWDGARRLVARGHAIGSHSSYHAILSRESPEEQKADLTNARQVLETELAVPAPLLAYPNGTDADYDDATFRAASAAGHSFAATVLEGLNRADTPPFEIRRSFMVPQRGALDLVANLRYLARRELEKLPFHR